MDLSTIKRKLDTGQYKDPWEVCTLQKPRVLSVFLLDFNYIYCDEIIDFCVTPAQKSGNLGLRKNQLSHYIYPAKYIIYCAFIFLLIFIGFFSVL
jgi:hypothetical protein